MDGIDRLMEVKVDLDVQGYCDNKKKEFQQSNDILMKMSDF